MNRWTLVGGLTVTLLLLLTLSGFCVWATRGLTDDIGNLISQNYDSIRTVRELRSALTRINAQCLAVKDPAGIPATSEIFLQEKEVVEKRLARMNDLAVSPFEREVVARVTALSQRYFSAYDELFSLKPRANDRLVELSRTIISLTGDLSAAADQLVDYNENALMARRDNAALKGRRVTVIVMGFAVFSLGIYVLTSMRLARGIFEPLRRLRDAIQLVSARRFDTIVPVEGGEELGQIAGSFNAMAGELQRYISETDERAVTANRISRAILETLPYPIYIVDGDFTVRQANPRAETLSKVLGIPGVLPGEVRRRIDEAAAQDRDMLDDDIRRAVYLAPTETGPTVQPGRYYLPQVFRMAGAFGAGDGWAVLLVEVTRLRRNDEARTKALTTLGHEVKTPVAGIRMSLHLLLEEKLGAINPDQRELLEVARDSCERLLAVLQALLELARLESGRTELRPEPYPPGDLLTEAVVTHGDAVRRTGGTFVLEIPPGLPLVLVDLLQTNLVLANFLSNAGKYGLPGQPVVLRAQARADGFVRLSVLNHGRPLSEAEQAHVFDPFFRRPGENSEGTGLGLAICREIAMLHGGRVGVFCQDGSDLIEFFFDLRRAK